MSSFWDEEIALSSDYEDDRGITAQEEPRTTSRTKAQVSINTQEKILNILKDQTALLEKFLAWDNDSRGRKVNKTRRSSSSSPAPKQ
ncbi:hypothetical protein RRG08_008221 [Elysia crispata]|uniref:Uncharacterized protein n=1 Tax=Elysia crispata TaxID=231223 RepID=A0AAE0YB83_9GAST|nr:hypothetical protein RRG08_008221 [Elysia crispata]